MKLFEGRTIDEILVYLMFAAVSIWFLFAVFVDLYTSLEGWRYTPWE